MSRPHRRPRRFGALLLAMSFVVLPAAATDAHTAGSCLVDTSQDRCETWSATYDDATIAPPSRSDQFVTATAANADTVFVTMKDVALNPDNPYAATGSWLLLAHDAGTGQVRWSAQRRARVYDMPLDVTVSPDGRHVYVTGASYNAYSIAATDSRIVTVAYDAATGAELWARSWDNRTDGTDNSKVVITSADGREVYVGGVTTSTSGHLDYVVVAYDAQRGRQLWSATYDGPGADSDALFGLAASPDGRHVYATGWSRGAVEYDNDYGTVAFTTARGRGGAIAWVARYDGAHEHRSDRGNAIAVAPDGTVLVTGDSYAPGAGSTAYAAATVAYDGQSGAQLWDARYVGDHGGLNAGSDLVATAEHVVVTAQSPGEEGSGHDAATLAYDLATGEQRWVHREERPQSSELSSALALSPTGETAYLLTTATPMIQYTSLGEIGLHAYSVADGTELWTSWLDAGAGNAVRADAIATLPDGRVAVAGHTTLSQNPLGPPSQNRYDALTAVFRTG